MSDSVIDAGHEEEDCYYPQSIIDLINTFFFTYNSFTLFHWLYGEKNMKFILFERKIKILN